MEKIRFRDKMEAAEAGTPVEEQENLPLSSEAERHLQGIEGEKLRYRIFTYSVCSGRDIVAGDGCVLLQFRLPPL